MNGIFEIIFLVALVPQRLVSSAPVNKAIPTQTKSPTVIHCDLQNNVRRLISHLPYATGNLEQSVYKRYQRLVSVDERKYLHKHLHLYLTSRWTAATQPGQVQLVHGPLSSNLTVPLLLTNISSALSCSICSLRNSKEEYRTLPNSSKVVKELNHIQQEVKDLTSEIVFVEKAIKTGTKYTTTCMTCQINLTKGKRSRKQIALALAIALENLHAELLVMKANLLTLKRASCPPSPVVTQTASIN